MPKAFQQLLTLLTPRERRHLFGVLLAMLVMGIAQMAGVGVVLPFVSLLTNPDAVHHSAALSWLYNAMGFETVRGFLLFIGSGLLVVLVASNIITAATVWLTTRFSWSVQERVSTRLLSGYLHQPYETTLTRNSADPSKNILVETQQLALGVMIPILTALAFGIASLLTVGFLFWLQPLLALTVAVIFGGAYLLVYLTIRRVLLRIGRKRVTANTDRFKAVNEAFGSAKEVKIMARERHFLQRYQPAAATYASTMSSSLVLGQVPRYAIEGLAFGIIMAAMLYLVASGHNLQAALPLASAFIIAGYRLLPALQNVYQGIAQTRFNQSVFDTLVKDLTVQGTLDKEREQSNNNTPLPFNRAIQLHNLTYRYPNTDTPSIDNVSLIIPRNSFVAFTGTTGAGKTTLVDIILGLLVPSAGETKIDDVALTAQNKAQWQANLGYVPQEIYLTDSSISSNIAYGLPDDEIDHHAVERAAKIANIHDFITQKLPHGYGTMVGERGVRLSGGQRQRIGIARALYRDPSVIVLDEATSALDNETERRIVNELDAMRGGRTLIVIAHRLTTVQRCHQVFLLKEGKVAASGTYDDLVRNSAEFGYLVNAHNENENENENENALSRRDGIAGQWAEPGAATLVL